MNKREEKFVAMVWEYYKRHGRRSLPWRLTKNPYDIHVSEIMLQQTQVDRVLPKYEAFLKKFPTVETLAMASLAEVLKQWQGLGYNSRAKRLHECAVTIHRALYGEYPRTYERLVELPGIGPYTAGAIMAFAYNKPVPVIERNIPTVFLYHFFKHKTDVDDKDILKLIEKTLDTQNPREWYWALMDYGAYLKKTQGNPNSKSTSYTKQSTFKNSDRQIRGALVRLLTENKCTRKKLLQILAEFEDIRVDAQLEKLMQEGMVEKNKQMYQLPS